MKRIMVSLVIVILGLSYAAFALCWVGDACYPISNFSFEEVDDYPYPLTSWYYGGYDSEIKQSFAYSLHYAYSANIHVESQKDAYLQQIIGRQPGVDFDDQPCYLIAFVKTKGVTSTTGGGAKLRVITDTPGDYKEYESNIITGDRNWTKLIVPFYLIELYGDHDSLTIQIGLFDAQGEVWIDFVQLVPRDSLVCQKSYQIPNLQNISFEEFLNVEFDEWEKSTGVGCTITPSGSEYVLGSHSAEFTFSPQLSNRTSTLSQSTDVRYHFRTYNFSAYIRTDDLVFLGQPVNPGAYYRINYDEDTIWTSEQLSGDNGWVRVDGVFEKSSGPLPLEVEAVVTAKEGKAWFDWVNLRLNYVQNVEFNDWGGPPGDLVVWDHSGDGWAGFYQNEGHESTPCGKVYNEDDSYDTALLQTLGIDLGSDDQDFICLHEGGTYRLSGWIKTVNAVPYEGVPMPLLPCGAFVQLTTYSTNPGVGEVEVARSECLIGTSDGWQEFSLVFTIPLDFFEYDNDGIGMFVEYNLRCCLHYASGTAYFDDINITELEFTEDIATVVPQPQAIEYRGYHSDPLVTFDGGVDAVTIYYTPDDHPHVLLGDTYYFSAENLRQELNRAFYECGGDYENYDSKGWEGIKYDYPIEDTEEDGHVVALTEEVDALNKPCIILGDPESDHSDGHLFQAELEKRGIVLPEDFNPEGYMMDIGEDIILIAASDQDGAGLTKGAGSFYGTQTLLQLLDIEHRVAQVVMGETFHRNTVVAPACYIYDFPDMEWRGQMTIIGHWLRDLETDDYPGWRLYMETGFWEDTDNNVIRNQKLFAKKMANFKMNRLSAYSMVFFFLEYDVLPPVGDGPVPYDKNYKYLESLFNYCRKLHIEPIPMMGDYYFALLRHNGNCLEYMIYDSEYIDDNNLCPGQGDYYDPVPDQDTYPVPMPQPSWEFTIGRDPDKKYYFEEHEVNVWDEEAGDDGPGYELKSTLAYRVCYREEEGENVYPIRVEEKVDGDWVELVEGEYEDYELENVGLNTTMYVGEGEIGTSYLRLKGGGFYGYEGDEKAYITFTDLNQGTEVRVSYAAPIKWTYINTAGEENAKPRQLAYWTCMSYFDDDGDDYLFNDIPEVSSYSDLSDEGFDNPGAWTSWDSRDIWYVALYQMINRLKPRYIDIQHCEQYFMHTDDRCQVERKYGVRDDYCEDEQYPDQMLSKYHNAFILGKEIDWMRRAMEEIDGEEGTDTRLMMFGDQFNSHNGTFHEGRCWWDWYHEEVDPYHQPDADDPNWEGDERSHVYYQPAMGGMGGWTWDSSQIKNPLLMASTYIGGKDDMVIAEWGYQSGIFDDREGFEYIEWRDKYELRYDELVDQGFTNFVGMCAGYAVIGGDWRRLRIRCHDKTALEGEPDDYCSPGLDGTNLNWVQLIGDNMSKEEQEEIDITLYLETSTHDAYEGCTHFVTETGEGCHVGAVQDGVAYLDDVEVSGEGMSGTIDNPGFEFGLSGWTHTELDYVTWECSDEQSHGGTHSCKLEIDRTGHGYEIEGDTFIKQDYYEALQTPTVDLNFSVYVKTIKLDALRHLNPKIWTDLTDEYYQSDEILGMMSTFWGHGNRTFSTEPSSADWMWSREYPASPFIKYLHYDPYFLFDTYNFRDVVNEPYLDGPYPRDLEELMGE